MFWSFHGSLNFLFSKLDLFLLSNEWPFLSQHCTAERSFPTLRRLKHSLVYLHHWDHDERTTYCNPKFSQKSVWRAILYSDKCTELQFIKKSLNGDKEKSEKLKEISCISVIHGDTPLVCYRYSYFISIISFFISNFPFSYFCYLQCML